MWQLLRDSRNSGALEGTRSEHDGPTIDGLPGIGYGSEASIRAFKPPNTEPQNHGQIEVVDIHLQIVGQLVLRGIAIGIARHRQTRKCAVGAGCKEYQRVES